MSLTSAQRARTKQTLDAYQMHRSIRSQLRDLQSDLDHLDANVSDAAAARATAERAEQLAASVEYLQSAEASLGSQTPTVVQWPKMPVFEVHHWMRVLLDAGVYNELAPAGRDTFIVLVNHMETMKILPDADFPNGAALAQRAGVDEAVIAEGLNQLEYLDWLEQSSDTFKLVIPYNITRAIEAGQDPRAY